MKIDWGGIVCWFLGHTAPFQRAGSEYFECRRCKLAFGRVAPERWTRS